jgi:hypothetical protein
MGGNDADDVTIVGRVYCLPRDQKRLHPKSIHVKPNHQLINNFIQLIHFFRSNT